MRWEVAGGCQRSGWGVGVFFWTLDRRVFFLQCLFVEVCECECDCLCAVFVECACLLWGN